MSKIHYVDHILFMDAPKYVRDRWRKEGLNGAACGYVRKNTTWEKENVTCFYCLNALKKLNE